MRRWVPARLLTRTNGEALVLSRALFDAGVPHRYQRRGQEKAAPAWLGELSRRLQRDSPHPCDALQTTGAGRGKHTGQP